MGIDQATAILVAEIRAAIGDPANGYRSATLCGTSSLRGAVRSFRQAAFAFRSALLIRPKETQISNMIRLSDVANY